MGGIKTTHIIRQETSRDIPIIALTVVDWLIKSFLTRLNKQMSVLEAALAHQDHHVITIEAQKIKGAAADLMAERLCAIIAKELEIAAISANTAAAAQILDRLKKNVAVLQDSLKNG